MHQNLTDPAHIQFFFPHITLQTKIELYSTNKAKDIQAAENADAYDPVRFTQDEEYFFLNSLKAHHNTLCSKVSRLTAGVSDAYFFNKTITVGVPVTTPELPDPGNLTTPLTPVTVNPTVTATGFSVRRRNLGQFTVYNTNAPDIISQAAEDFLVYAILADYYNNKGLDAKYYTELAGMEFKIFNDNLWELYKYLL